MFARSWTAACQPLVRILVGRLLVVAVVKTSRLWLLSPQMLASFMKPSVLLSLST